MSGVLLIATGGTIASRPGADGVQAALRGEEVLARAGITDGVDVLDIGHGPSWSFSPVAVEAIARTVVAEAETGEHRGVVVTHGTDTMEDSAFLTWLLGGATASARSPIVFTGAMRHADHSDSDGPTNLREAVALAAAGPAGGRPPGPVVRIGGATHHARWVTKTDTRALDSFRSPGAPADGEPPDPPPACGDATEWRVAEVHAHAGISKDLIGFHLDWDVRGLVVEGTGAGNVHRDLVPGLERALEAGIPVVVTSRCATGTVAPEYGGPGGGRFLAELGCILAGDLPTHKARLALAVALGADPARAAVAAWFARLLGTA